METKPWERLLSWVLTIVMVFQMIPVQAFAADTDDHTGHDHGTQIETVIPGEETTEGDGSGETTPTDPQPSVEPSVEPSTEPSAQPSAEPTATPTPEPTETPVEENTSSDNVQKVQQMIDDFMVKYGLTTGMSDEEITNAVFAATSDPRPDYDAIAAEAEKLTEDEIKAIEASHFEKIEVADMLYAIVEKMNTPELIGNTVSTSDGAFSFTTTGNNGSWSTQNTKYSCTATKGGWTSAGSTNTLTIRNVSNKTYRVRYSYSIKTYTGSVIGMDSSSGSVDTIVSPGDVVDTYTIQGGKRLDGDASVTISDFSYEEFEAYFMVGTEYFDDLSDAIDCAIEGESKTIVQVKNYTLPAGEYEIPAGITLLVPSDAANTVFTTEPAIDTEWTTPTLYRKLTMSSGAKLTVYGTLSIGGRQAAKQLYNGCVTGPYGQIDMASDSKIDVYGALYAWGYITGSGAVEAFPDSVVYEDFQMTDWRGGSATGAISQDDSINVFPFSQYHVQNIEVPLTLHADAIEYGFMSVNISYVGIQKAAIPFIGGEGDTALFILEEGTVIKDYIEGTGRLHVKSNGNFKIASVSMSMNLGLAGTHTIDSVNYVLPINSSMTVDIESGSIVMSQDIALMPGSEMYIREGAKCTLLSESDIFVYDYDVYPEGLTYNAANSGWCTQYNYRYCPLPYAPGGLGTEGYDKDAFIQVDGVVEATAGAVYTTTGGANIFSTGTGEIQLSAGTATETYQLLQNDTNVSTTPVAITNAKLKNADGTYKETGAETYRYYNGEWHTVNCGGAYTTTVTTPATCTEAGAGTDTCACGYSKPSDIPALGHKWDNGVETQAPTCSVEGVTTFTCERGCTKTEPIPATNQHDFNVKVEVVAPTCTETGYTVYKCATCDNTENSDEVAANGHTVITDALKDPTCTETGLTEGSHCSVCGQVIVAQQETAALGHAYSEEITQSPGCTTTGIKTFTCSRCGDSYTEEIAAKGHSLTIEHKAEEVTATCTQLGGYWRTMECDVCGMNSPREFVKTAEMLPHTHSEQKQENIVPNNCTVAGSYDAVIYCTVCEAELSRTQIPVPATGHTEGAPVKENETEADCVNAGGYDMATYCTVCNAEINREHTVIKAFGHTKETEGKQENFVPATCTTAGSYDMVYMCSVCGEEAERTTITVNATGHPMDNLTYVRKKDATCTTDGHEEYFQCNVCQSITDIKANPATIVVIPATGHTNGTPVIENSQAATCTVAGKYENVVYCTVCGAEVSRDEVTVDAKGHSYTSEVTAPT